ncbi:MAG TPA: dUTP diphosphatase [Methylovirgula sp.]|nr:dUTP diphosphatase [Methylovirgula sp.]
MREEAASLAVTIRQFPHGEGLPVPAYQSAGAAGADLFAAIAPDAKIFIEPGARLLVPTGIGMQLPEGFEAQIRPRSGLALQYGVTVLNAPGTIDCDYRGEIGVLLVNFGSEPFEVVRGARIAQLVIAPVKRAVFVAAATLEETQRAAGGYGSTGSFREKKT